MGNMKKYYSGSIANELMAAKVYDRFSIQNLGLRAKTNFDYKRNELIEIIKEMEEGLNNEQTDNPCVNTIILKSSSKNKEKSDSDWAYSLWFQIWILEYLIISAFYSEEYNLFKYIIFYE